MIYLDNAATTSLSPRVFESMLPYLNEEYGNAGAIYTLGRRAANAVAKARTQVADLIGARPEQIVFTAGGTEANNLAILGCKNYLKRVGRTHVITSLVEHNSVLRAAKALCRNEEKCIEDDFCISYLGVNKYGRVLVDKLDSLVANNTGLVSIMYVNNEVGTSNSIDNVGNFCRRNNILFHTDCVQAAGVHRLDVDDFLCDFMSISSHKIYGPKGVGALYVRDKNTLAPIINGGSTQEFGVRGGTENVAGIVGFGEACALAEKGRKESLKTVVYYKQRFYELLKKYLSKYGLDNQIGINGAPSDYSSKILNIALGEGVDAETLVLMLDTHDIYVSAGSACQSRESKPSHVLTAMGLTDEQAMSSVRISFSKTNKLNEIEFAAKVFADCIAAIRKISV